MQQGDVLGPYRIESELGSGGMGTVYSAVVCGRVPPLSEGARVALKVVHAHLLESEGFFKRFLREAEIGRSVRHANVVQTFECDSLMRDGRRHDVLVMEHVEGQTLRELSGELGCVPEELCRHVGGEIAQGLSAIHAAGAIHRDIKPENVLITPDHVVKVMDLGVARLIDAAVRLSQTGGFVGSLQYAAPESFGPGADQIDGRADLYALGVLLYELVTGRHPIQGHAVREIVHAVLHTTPRRVGELNPKVSPFFEEVIETLIAKERGERFASADDVARTLREGESSAWWRARAEQIEIATSRPLRRIRIPRETALYGRETELALLQSRWAKAAAGDARVLLIEGEAGIGKSRLIDEFVNQLSTGGEDVNFLFGSYPPGGAATASGAWSTAYREHFGERGSAAYLAQTPTLVPAFNALLRGEAVAGGERGLTKDSLQTCFVHATRALADERPTIVLIEDLHLAPEEGRALFTSIACAIPGTRVMLIGTHRRGVSETWLSGLTRLPHARQMALGRLGPRDLAALLRETFGSVQLSDEVGWRIAQKSDGNPFFAFEIVRSLREQRFITQREDGKWSRTSEIDEISIPSTVMDLIQARMSALTSEEHELLDVASCCGVEFDPGIVAAAAGVARIPALRALGRIENQHRLIHSAGRGFVFDHNQVREALHDRLPAMLREEYHAAIATALEDAHAAAEKEPGDLDGETLVSICEHFITGARPDRAHRYVDAALEHLAVSHAFARSVELLERVLAIPDLVTGAERLRILLAGQAALGKIGRAEQRVTLVQECVQLAREIGDPVEVARSLRALGNVHLFAGRTDEAIASFEAALHQAQVAEHRQLQGAIETGLGNAYQALSRADEAQAHHEASLAIARELGYRPGEGICLGNLGVVHWSVGRNEEARALYEEAITIARETNDIDAEGTSTGNLGIVMSNLGHLDKARTLYERQLEIAREAGNRPTEALVMGNIGALALIEGRLSEEHEWHARSLALSREIGYRSMEAFGLHNLGGSFGRLGESARNEVLQREALALTREIGAREVEAAILCELGSCADERGDVEEAERCLVDARDRFVELGVRDLHAAGAWLALGRFYADRGRSDEARPIFDEARAIAESASYVTGLVIAVACIARLDPSVIPEARALFDEHHDEMSRRNRVDAEFLMWQLTADRDYLERARAHVAEIVDAADERHRETIRSGVDLYRRIADAG